MSEEMGVVAIADERESEESKKDNPLLESDFGMWLTEEYKSKTIHMQRQVETILEIVYDVLNIEDFATLTYKDTTKFRNFLVNESDWKNSTQTHRMMWLKLVIKSFNEYCRVNSIKYPLNFKSEDIKGIPKHKNNIAPVLTENEVLKLFEAIKEPIDKALFKLNYFGATRIGDLQNLKRKNIDENIDRIDFVNGKAGKSQSVIIEHEAIEALIDYYDFHRRYAEPEYDEYVFISQRGFSMSDTQIRSRLKNIAVEAGIQKRVFPHLLRASNATHRIMQGWNLWEVKNYLRHAFIQDTECYIRTAEILRQGNVKIGLIKLRQPTFNRVNNNLFQSNNHQADNNNGKNEKLELHKRYLAMFEKGYIDLPTFKELNTNLQKWFNN